MLNLGTFDPGTMEDETDQSGMYIANPGGQNYQLNPQGSFSPQDDESYSETLEPVKGMIIATLIALPFWLALGILLIR